MFPPQEEAFWILLFPGGQGVDGMTAKPKLSDSKDDL